MSYPTLYNARVDISYVLLGDSVDWFTVLWHMRNVADPANHQYHTIRQPSKIKLKRYYWILQNPPNATKILNVSSGYSTIDRREPGHADIKSAEQSNDGGDETHDQRLQVIHRVPSHNDQPLRNMGRRK